MSIWKEADGRVRRWGLVDVKLAQSAAFFVALVVAKLFPQVLAIDAWWFAAAGLACAAKPTVGFFWSREPIPDDGGGGRDR